MTTQRNGINIPKDFMDIFTPYVMNLLEARLTDTFEIYEFSAQYFEGKIRERQSKSPRSRAMAEEVKCVSQDARREFKKETRKKIWERDISSKRGPLDILPDLQYDSSIEFHPMGYQGQCSDHFQKSALFDKELPSDDKHFTSEPSALQGLSTPTSISKVLQHLRHIPGYIAALIQCIEELPEDAFAQDAINNFMHCECFIWKPGKCSQHFRSMATQTEIQGEIQYPKKEEFQKASKDEKVTFGYIRDIMRKAKYFVQSIENQAHFRVSNNKSLKRASSHRGKIKNITFNVEKCSKSVSNAKDVMASITSSVSKTNLSDSIENLHSSAVGLNSTFIRSGSLGLLEREPYQLPPFDNIFSDEETNEIPKYKVKMLRNSTPENEKNSRYKKKGARYTPSNSIDYDNITGINHCYLLCDIDGRHWLRTFLSHRKLRQIVDDVDIRASTKDLGTPVMILRFFSVRSKSSTNRCNFNFVRAWYFSRSLRSLHEHHSK